MRSPCPVQAVAQADSPPVYFAYHVPKCAGRTIDRHLATNLPDDAYFRIRKRKGASRFLLPRYELCGMPHPSRLRAVGGHFLGMSLESLFTGRPVKRFILLRDPASHIVSYYNFRMSRYLSQGLRPYSFEVAYGATRRNFVTHFILSNFLELPWWRAALMSDQDKYDVVNALLANFWFVGDYALCDNLVAALGKALDISGKAVVRNKHVARTGSANWRSLALNDLPAGPIAQIRRENILDQRLWETWRDAGHDVRPMRPRALMERTSPDFISTEATRFVYQLMRRAQRRWGYVEASRMPAPAGLITVPR